MDTAKVLELFKKTNALLEGHFLLSSGLHSPRYLQCALLLQNPDIAETLCKALAGKFLKAKPTVVIAPALGGVLVSYELARALGVRGIFTERVDGVMQLRRGFSLAPEDRVIVVEDVVTTGKSTGEVLDVVRGYGASIVGIGAIVDRSGGALALELPVTSLIKVQAPAFKPEACPQCKDNIPLVKPGSRPQKKI
ncbi:MAG: orotate phosphoribosyltransferase [Candidatus Omnitrophica bacterium]|nr:orotate phosphoribosyltransferase [Candidatus Omnitrophota bacterium]